MSPYRTPDKLPEQPKCRGCRQDTVAGWALLILTMSATTAALVSTRPVLRAVCLMWLVLVVVEDWPTIDSDKHGHTCGERNDDESVE